jgi:ADP-ribose pyrophosphatase YjhB (NUDIX family)
MNYCSVCGYGRLLFEPIGNDPIPRYYCPNCDTIHYQNPKMVVGCLVYHQDAILLCRRAIEPRYGLWNLPAGYLENGETAEQGALRETWEEAGARARIEGVQAVYSLPHINQVYVHFLARLENLDFTPGEESLEVVLYKEHEMPWEDMAFSSSTFALQHYFRDRREKRCVQPHIGYLDRDRRTHSLT